MRLVLHGQLPSGKGQIRKTWANGRLIHYPQKRFTDWRKNAVKQLTPQTIKHRLPFTERLSMNVVYTPSDKRTRDVSGLLDAIFHLLGYAGVVKDDGLIRELHWREQVLNRQEPRVEIEVSLL